MNVLPITTALLVLLAILNLARWREASDRQLLVVAMENHMEAKRALQNGFECALYTLKVQSSRERKKTWVPRHGERGKTKGERKKLSGLPSRLNLPIALDSSPKGRRFRQTLLNLMDLLYEGQPFYRREVAEQILERLAQEGGAHSLDELACHDLGELHPIWIAMLKGKADHYPSLLDYITLQGETKINLVHAPPILLKALFGKEIEKREQLMERYSDDLGSLEAELRNLFEPLRELADMPKSDFTYTMTHHSKVISVAGSAGELTLQARYAL